MRNFKSPNKPLTLLFLLCLFSIGAWAQGTVNGTVIDEAGDPIIGASVQVQGTKTGAVTDFNGNFNVQAASNATLTISYVGYVTETVRVSGRNNIKSNYMRKSIFIIFRWVLIIIFFEILIPPEPFMRDAPHFFYRKYNKNLL